MCYNNPPVYGVDITPAMFQELADVDITFIGLLGPPARKERLLGELGDAGRKLGPRLHAPVGIDIGADTAESIAVSIAAEIQQVLA